MKKLSMTSILTKNALDYAKYTITDRAIPSLSDGLKNIHRRIIWSMYLDKLTYDKDRTKSVNAVGSVLRFSPHGDSSVYGACVRLANDSVLYPLIDGKGSFSSITSRDVNAGASRYTEMRLSPITQELLKDIDKDVVDMINNYDDTKLEPTDLPVTFPLILSNPNLGIAVGIASNICSFNLNDVIDNTVNILEGKDTFTMFPDFPTGGIIINDKNIMSKIKNEGVGTFYIRSKYYIEDNSIVVTEIPYTTTREAIIESIISLVKDNKIKEIIDVNDHTGVNGLRITIEVKNNTDKELLMERLFKMTPLQHHFGCNFTLLVNNKPMTLGTDKILEEWIKFRINCIKRGAKFDLAKKQDKLHLLTGLKNVLLDIEKTISIIRETKKNSDVVNNLSKEFSIDKIQAEYIADIKLRYLNEEYLIERINETDVLLKEVEYLNSIINSDDNVREIIIDQLRNVQKKYGKARKSDVINLTNITKVNLKEAEIEDYNIKLYLTEQMYLKKIPLTSLRGNSKQNLKDDDFIKYEIETTNKSDILLFSDKYNTYKLKAHELSDTKLSNLGEFLPALLQLKDEKIVYVTTTVDYKEDLLIGYESGKLARINMSAYFTKQKRKKLENTYNKESKPLYWNTIKEDIDVGAISDIDKVIIMNTSNINAKSSKNTMGVTFQKSKNDSKVVNYFNIDEFECSDMSYYKVSSAGVGKYKKKEDEIIKIN
ncbi:DNA topoisomerase (ATP-hydrolyzing) subunit A [Priestia megaterium]